MQLGNCLFFGGEAMITWVTTTTDTASTAVLVMTASLSTRTSHWSLMRRAWVQSAARWNSASRLLMHKRSAAHIRANWMVLEWCPLQLPWIVCYACMVANLESHSWLPNWKCSPFITCWLHLQGYLEELVRLRESQLKNAETDNKKLKARLEELQSRSREEKKDLEAIVLELQEQL